MMTLEPTNQLVMSLPNDDDEPTEPKMPAQRRTKPAERVLQVRHNDAFTVSIDEQGIVKLLVAGHTTTILKPEEAFDLLDFLFEHRNLLATLSAQIAEQQREMQDTDC